MCSYNHIQPMAHFIHYDYMCMYIRVRCTSTCISLCIPDKFDLEKLNGRTMPKYIIEISSIFNKINALIWSIELNHTTPHIHAEFDFFLFLEIIETEQKPHAKCSTMFHFIYYYLSSCS